MVVDHNLITADSITTIVCVRVWKGVREEPLSGGECQCQIMV